MPSRLKVTIQKSDIVSEEFEMSPQKTKGTVISTGNKFVEFYAIISYSVDQFMESYYKLITVPFDLISNMIINLRYILDYEYGKDNAYNCPSQWLEVMKSVGFYFDDGFYCIDICNYDRPVDDPLYQDKISFDKEGFKRFIESLADVKKTIINIMTSKED